MAHRAERTGSHHVRLFMARLGGIQEAAAEREAHLLCSLRGSEENVRRVLSGDVPQPLGGLPASLAPGGELRSEALQ